MLCLLLSSLEGHALRIVLAIVSVQIVLKPVLSRTSISLRELVTDGSLKNNFSIIMANLDNTAFQFSSFIANLARMQVQRVSYQLVKPISTYQII